MLRRALVGAIFGSAIGVLALVVGLLRALKALARGVHVTFANYMHPAFLYFVSFVVAGALVGVAWPLGDRRGGRYLLGVLGATVFMGGIVGIDHGAPWQWDYATIVMWAVLSVLFGIAAGYGLSRGMNAEA